MAEIDEDRLTLAQIEEFVAPLSDKAVETLALGPMRDLSPMEPEYWLEDTPRDCRACQALEPIKDSSPPAMRLWNWHNLVSRPFKLLNGLISDDKPLTEVGEQMLHDELMHLFGMLAFSRCIVIYAVARAEKLKRDAERPTPVGSSA